MYPAAHDSRIYAIGQQKSSGYGAITHAQRTIHHLCQKAGEQHDKKRLPVNISRYGSEAIYYLSKRNKAQDCMPQYHKTKSKQTPFNDQLPFLATGFV